MEEENTYYLIQWATKEIKEEDMRGGEWETEIGRERERVSREVEKKGRKSSEEFKRQEMREEEKRTQ